MESTYYSPSNQPAFLDKNISFHQDSVTKNVGLVAKTKSVDQAEEAILEVQGILVDCDLPPIVSRDQ
jgi:hypothetical protein